MVFSFKAQLSTDSVPENYADFFTRIIFNRLITNELCIKKETRFVKTEYISRFLKNGIRTKLVMQANSMSERGTGAAFI